MALGGVRFQRFPAGELLSLMVDRFGLTTLDYWNGNRGTVSTETFLDMAAAKGVSIFALNIPDASKRLLAPGADRNALALGQKELAEGIDTACLLGARYLSIYPPSVSEWSDFRTTVKMFASAMRPVVAKAEEHGIVMMIENTLSSHGQNAWHTLNPSRLPELMLALVEEIDSPSFKLCFDPCNWYAMGVEPFPYAYEMLREGIATIHVKDCCRYSPLMHYGAPSSDYLFDTAVGRGEKSFTPDQAGQFLPVPVGLGALNWERMLDRFRADGFEGKMTLDPFCAPGHLLDWCDQSLRFLETAFERPVSSANTARATMAAGVASPA